IQEYFVKTCSNVHNLELKRRYLKIAEISPILRILLKRYGVSAPILHKKTRLTNSQYGVFTLSTYAISMKITIQRYSKSSKLGMISKIYYERSAHSKESSPIRRIDLAGYGGLRLMEAYEPKVPKDAPQSPEQAPLSPVPALVYPEYLALSDDDLLSAEDQPLPADASPTTLSPGYIADLELIEDDFDEDPEMDHVDYDVDEEEEESSDDEEEKHLAPTNSAHESAATPLPPRSPHNVVPFSQTSLRRVRKTVRPQIPLSSFIKTRIVEYASAPTPLIPPPSSLTQLSSPLPLIPSPPLPLPSPDHRGVIPNAEMSPRKRFCFTAPSHRFEIRESSEYC
ncbi:hypothetical protein Tco_0982475, partial [Tanacetum coccineum]